MRLLSRILGTSKALDAVIATGDALFETKEERKSYKLAFLGSIEPFKVVQRLIVGAVMTMWLLIGLNYLIAIWLKVLTDIDAISLLNELVAAQFIWLPTSLTFGLYLGGGVLESKKNKRK